MGEKCVFWNNDEDSNNNNSDDDDDGRKEKEKQLLTYPSGCNRWRWQPQEYFDLDDDDEDDSDDFDDHDEDEDDHDANDADNYDDDDYLSVILQQQMTLAAPGIFFSYSNDFLGFVWYIFLSALGLGTIDYWNGPMALHLVRLLWISLM